MAITEVTGVMKYKDADGNTYIMLPATTKENVEGLEEVDAHLLDKNNPHEVTAEQIGAASADQVAYIDSEDNEDVADTEVGGSGLKNIIFSWEVDEVTGEEINHKLEYGDIILTEFIGSSDSYAIQIDYDEHANLVEFLKGNIIMLIKKNLTYGTEALSNSFTFSDGFIEFGNFEILNPDREM